MHPLLKALAALTMASAVGTTGVGCSDDEPAFTTATFDVEALPGLGETQQQMLDLILKVHAEIERDISRTAPWDWLTTYSIAPCIAPLTGQGQALYFPDLVSKTTATPDEWDRILAITETNAHATGLTEYREPANPDGNRFVEFKSSDGRTLRVLGKNNLVLTATIACRRTDGLIVEPDGSVPMPADP